MSRKNILLTILAVSLMALASPAVPQEEGEEELLRKATGYFFQKKFDMAESLFHRIIDKNPDNAQACAYLGDIFLIKKRYDGALELYRKSLQINPEAGENYFRIGQIHYYRREGKQAVDNFKKAIEADTQLRFAYYHIGLTSLMILRDKENTIANWETYLQVAPDDPQYDRIKRAIELLKDPNFVIPPPGSDMTIEEALMLGGVTIDKTMHRTTDKEAGHESKKTKRKLEDIYLDDDL